MQQPASLESPALSRLVNATWDFTRRYWRLIVVAPTNDATFVEIPIVIELRHGAEGLRDLDHFIGRAGIELVPVDAEHGKLACSAFSRFEKGRHRAGLNYGDCFS